MNILGFTYLMVWWHCNCITLHITKCWLWQCYLQLETTTASWNAFNRSDFHNFCWKWSNVRLFQLLSGNSFISLLDRNFYVLTGFFSI